MNAPSGFYGFDSFCTDAHLSVYRSLDLLLHRLLSAIRGNKPRKSYYFMTLYVTKEDVMRYFANVPEYTKVNAYKDMRIDIYI
jgi:hypothetical protein